MRKLFAIFSFFLMADQTTAAEYFCSVDKKWSNGSQYSSEDLLKWKFSVKIDDEGNDAALFRCSYATSVEAVTCDRYEADFITQDTLGNKKYYYFRGQFDVQLFTNLHFIENNGRGDIATGKCEFISP
jgi:hypothetical protein